MKEDFSCGVIPYIESESGVQFLLVLHNTGHWAFPKGHPEVDENSKQTALRELKEETGIDNVNLVEGFEAHEKYSFEKDGVDYCKTVLYFLGRMMDRDVHILVTELSDYHWVGFDEALNLITYPETKSILIEANDFLLKG